MEGRPAHARSGRRSRDWIGDDRVAGVVPDVPGEGRPAVLARQGGGRCFLQTGNRGSRGTRGDQDRVRSVRPTVPRCRAATSSAGGLGRSRPLLV
ncbi:MAG: hypothetical protein AVDCRST_MAG48-2695 [uncultured Friedmanniella sp.]|uniref:Uncharacterized protein n=1 Tax=uncultured Friedmanniella sp. TaxID=335381 RepID=A0A6J4L5X1_9ACTN|nr:MAG: hypothetical protein AVDCRST_MAG48-2695 [uncultured Friedmanniella sp.]